MDGYADTWPLKELWRDRDQASGRYYVNVRVLDTDVIVLIEVLVVSISPIHKKFFAFRMYLHLLNGPIIASVKTIMLAAWLKSQEWGKDGHDSPKDWTL